MGAHQSKRVVPVSIPTTSVTSPTNSTPNSALAKRRSGEKKRVHFLELRPSQSSTIISINDLSPYSITSSNSLSPTSKEIPHAKKCEEAHVEFAANRRSPKRSSFAKNKKPIPDFLKKFQMIEVPDHHCSTRRQNADIVANN